MTIEEKKVYNDIIEKIDSITPVLAEIINLLFDNFLEEDDYDEVDFDDKTVLVTDEDDVVDIVDGKEINYTMTESFIFSALGNLVSAKDALGVDLEPHEIIAMQQFQAEQEDSMELWREIRNNEEILKEGEEDETDESGTEN